jgi:hypothetical protein
VIGENLKSMLRNATPYNNPYLNNENLITEVDSMSPEKIRQILDNYSQKEIKPRANLRSAMKSKLSQVKKRQNNHVTIEDNKSSTS